MLGLLGLPTPPDRQIAPAFHDINSASCVLFPVHCARGIVIKNLSVILLFFNRFGACCGCSRPTLMEGTGV